MRKMTSFLNSINNSDNVIFYLSFQKSNNLINLKSLRPPSFLSLIGPKKYKFKWQKNYKKLFLLQTKTYIQEVKLINYLLWLKEKLKFTLKKNLEQKCVAENYLKQYKKTQVSKFLIMCMVLQVFLQVNQINLKLLQSNQQFVTLWDMKILETLSMKTQMISNTSIILGKNFSFRRYHKNQKLQTQ